MTGERIHGNQLHTLCDDALEVLLEASMDVASGMYPSGSFAYDANGNQTCDLSRDIIDMEYNVLNLPCRATFADGSRIDWLYTATGEKLRQTVIAATGDTLSRRDYIGSYLFEDNQFERYQLAEGYITPDDDFHAYIPDYQGNIVGVYNTSPNAITSIASPLDQHTCYYPYGLPFADSYGPTANRRKYGAKELTPDLGLNAYDFEARTLTPAFPMFTQQDSHAEKYYPLSLYLYCAGDPINLVDPDGRDAKISVEDHNIIVKANIILTGKEATNKLAKIFKNDIMSKWGNVKSIEYDGEIYNITWEIDVRVINENETKVYDGINNYMEIDGKTKRSSVHPEMNRGKLRNKGRLGYSIEKDCPMSHEFGHLLGISDKYVVDKNSPLYNKPIDTKWSKDIMTVPTYKKSIITSATLKILFYGVLNQHNQRLGIVISKLFPFIENFFKLAPTIEMRNKNRREPRQRK